MDMGSKKLRDYSPQLLQVGDAVVLLPEVVLRHDLLVPPARLILRIPNLDK
jgi:hypothetical protein